MTIRISGNVLLSDHFVNATVWSEDGLITRVQDGLDFGADHYSDSYIVPGFIDLQLNGAYGDDFTTHGETVTRVASRLPQSGCTSFLPTIITSSFESYPTRLQEICSNLPKVQNLREVTGANILGVHLEGPYLNPIKTGAHNSEFLREINVDEMIRWADPRIVRMVTLAPELPNATEAIRALNGNGITVSAGHSTATFDEAIKGFENGIRWGTHLFNAMSGLHHRDPGLAGALLSSSTPCGLIADGVHVHPMMVKLAYQAKGVDGLCLVTDAQAAMGTSKRSSQIGDRNTFADDTSVRLADGTLAGSILKMDQAVRNMIEFTGCSLAEAVNMASRTPATLLGLNRKGRIAEGCDADIVILDKELNVQKTFVAGKMVFEN
ncbi:MAG: N-acetylglucosamine-6-phosphate deacetylase [Chloroflexi bacterium]|nr:N-acetylglucosamine-6-phosphate deacetylase [Chloroflexota bacterium]